MRVLMKVFMGLGNRRKNSLHLRYSQSNGVE
jgi:hypothetical protein